MGRQNTRRRKVNRYSKSSVRNSPFSGMVWLVLGLLAGLLIATVFYLKQQHKLAMDSKPQHTSHSHRNIVQEQAPQFDFYHILPNNKKAPVLTSVEKESPKVILQAPDIEAPKNPINKEVALSEDRPSPPQEPSEHKQYMVQIASVRNYDEADKLKAQLSLMGFTVTIQKVTTGDTQLNRVVVGPYNSLSAAQEQQKRLRENSISSIVVKLTS